MPTVRLPANDWQPRADQRALWNYLESGGKRACEIAHRRWGKDEVALHWTAVAAHQRAGTYWHLLPEASQARKAIWEAINPHTGRRRIDEAFPRELRDATRENEMFMRLRCGSTWQVVGSDNYNSLVGSPPVGVVLSEWALANPASWAYLSPILRENGGWAMFITTPRGRNHAQKTLETAMGDQSWFGQTLRADQTPVFTREDLEAERRNLVDMYGHDMGDALFQQEYLCSFDAAVLGSYWGAEMAQAERSGRVARVDVDLSLPVHTAWDLGIGDSTVIWWFQVAGHDIRVVDYYCNHGQSLQHYAAVCAEKGYRPGDDWVPHDAKVRDLGTGRTRIETLIAAGRRPRLVPDHGLEDGINAARITIGRCWFDGLRCRDGIEALKSYRRAWDETNRCFSDRPLHDWASHPADGFRMLSMAWREMGGGDQATQPGAMLSIGSLNEVTFDDLWNRPRHGRAHI